MLSVVTLIQCLLFEFFHYWDTHPVVELYCTTPVDHKTRCLPHQYFFLICSNYGSVVCATQISSLRIGCTSKAWMMDLARGDYIEFQNSLHKSTDVYFSPGSSTQGQG